MRLGVVLVALVGCNATVPSGSDSGAAGGDDAAIALPDGSAGGDGCVSNGAACQNCVDDDGDGAVDGDDIHCTGAFDNDESSFDFGLPDYRPNLQAMDCFWDGNIGGGDDGCALHVCCALGASSRGECNRLGATYGFPTDAFDGPGSCAVSWQCAEACRRYTPPRCDCFGCCTRCNDLGCSDVLIEPQVSAGCDVDVLDDATRCAPCTKTACVSQCGDVILCNASEGCEPGEYCAQGCCVAVP